MPHELPDLIRFGREVTGDLAAAERREWWLANGLGAYAAGTIAGTLTRRYHGLLIAPVEPPLGRALVFAKADATLHLAGRELPLFTNRWKSGAVAPAGHVHLESFRLEGRMPVWRYAFGDTLIEHRVWLEPGADTVYVAWKRLAGTGEARLSVRLLVNARDHHGQGRPRDFNPVIEGGGSRVTVRHGRRFTLHLAACGGSIDTRHQWIQDFDLPVERERGLPDADCHLNAAEAGFDLPVDEWVGVVGSLSADASPNLQEAMRRFLARDRGELARAALHSPQLADAPAWIKTLVLAADSFVFRRKLAGDEGESVIAGYPWFGDWGRDTMIALPGLTLATGRFGSARRILETFARFVDRGMLPNVFSGVGKTPEYNSADAALWYIEAWRAYVETTGDHAAFRRVFPVLEDIVDWHLRGTRYGIAMDPADGLLRAGETGVQVTWMDAKVGDWVVTPRIGKPVEINALWFNALMAMAGLCGRIGVPAGVYRERALAAKSGFARFVSPATGALFDVIDGPAGDDPSLRPNQILAVSLAHSPLDATTQAKVVEVVGRDLLTSYGLRSLAPADVNFLPRYEGGVRARDRGYHQGPVWAWLLGHYAVAEYRVTGDARRAQSRLDPLRDHLLDAGLGTVSEIFDGAPPHMPRGAPAQAWSVACTLDAWMVLERAARVDESRVDSKKEMPRAA